MLLGRIREEARKRGNVLKLAQALGVKRQTVYNRLRHDGPFSDEDLKIAARCLEIAVPAVGFEEPAAAYDAAAFEHPAEARIPRYDVRLSAGAGAFHDRVRVLDRIPFTLAFIRRKLGRSGADGLVIVEAAGDSMEPTIGSGDLVMVDTEDQLVTDGLFALVIDDALVVKRLRRRADGLEVASDNAELYPPMFFPRDRAGELHVIGRVRWIGRVL